MSHPTFRSWFAGALALGLVLSPQIASACAVCFSGSEENRMAFLLTTIFLTLLPLLLIGSLVWWLRRRAVEMRRTLEEPNAGRSPAAP